MEPIKVNGLVFRNMLVNGLGYLRTREQEVNSLNVFPVSDGDTGTNMRLTLEHGLTSSEECEDLGALMKEVSKGMLFGARGNSGVILSQFFKGVSNAFDGCHDTDVAGMAEALTKGYETAYKAVVNPVEGTILTVVREGIEDTKASVDADAGFETFFETYIFNMRQSLKRTPQLLDVLREAGVIDSGALGFIIICEGMLGHLRGEQPENIVSEDLYDSGDDKNEIDFSSFREDSVFELGYCMEFILQLMITDGYDRDFDLSAFIDALSGMGESIVAIRDEGHVKVHIHTKRPDRIITLCQRYGEFLTFKLENMQLQHNSLGFSHAEEKPEHTEVAVVAVLAGDEIKECYRKLGCTHVIDGGQTMNPSVQDFIAAFDRLDADHIVVLPNNKNTIWAAEQAAEMSGKAEITVLPTRSMVDGYHVLSLDLPGEKPEARLKSMRSGVGSMVTLGATFASREYHGETLECSKGDAIVLMDDELIEVADSLLEATVSAVEKTADSLDAEICVIFRGKDATTEEADELAEMLEERCPLMDFGIMDGGQDTYSWLIGII